MEALSTLAFKGSIPEAIFEAKRQKKLFVVYIYGEDAESTRLNESTWTDETVAQALSKYCVLLHIHGGSADAVNFSAIYPYSSVPCLAAIGFNGAQVWKNEGYVAADVLALSLEKAWLSLHIQTTASILTAALASQKSDASASQGGSSDAAAVSPSTAMSVQRSERETAVTSVSTKGNSTRKIAAAESSKGSVEHKETSLRVEVEKEPKTKDDTSGTSSSTDLKGNHGSSVNRSARDSGVAREETKLPRNDAIDERSEKMETNKSSDVHLNIRLPEGTSLQQKFSMTSTLRMVKDYVNNNQTDEMRAYDLAIPYPRKVFSDDRDLEKSLSELGLFNRQALVVVPRQRATTNHRGTSYSDQTHSAADNGQSENPSSGGYFAYVRRLISYANPFSYFGSGPQSPTSVWEYNPNPALRSSVAQTDGPVGGNNIRNRRASTSRTGSNIHTLNHDDDDDVQFRGGNAYWNGNSTQYGGNNNDGQ